MAKDAAVTPYMMLTLVKTAVLAEDAMLSSSAWSSTETSPSSSEISPFSSTSLREVQSFEQPET